MKKIFSLLLVFMHIVLMAPQSVHAQIAGNLDMHGWSWSWTTGWIKLSSNKFDNATGQLLAGHDNNIHYGVTFAAATGLASGWAWSSNVGWISFNQADLALTPACTGPGGGAAVPARLVVDGATGGYKLVGTARAISPTQATNGWNQTSSNGNWNGCVYLHEDATVAPAIASMPSNPCNVKFGVKFAPFGTDFLGSGQAWNAAGPFNPVGGCASPLGYGGLSFVEFAGTFKSILKANTSDLTVGLTTSGWDKACLDAAPPGTTVLNNKTFNADYTVSLASGTSCTWYQNGGVPANPSSPFTPTFIGSQSFTGITGFPTGVSLQLRCYNPSSSYPDSSNPAVSPVVVMSCGTCSDDIDNPGSPVGKDFQDITCHEECNLTKPFHPEANEGGNQFCDPGTVVKGLPQIKEN